MLTNECPLGYQYTHSVITIPWLDFFMASCCCTGGRGKATIFGREFLIKFIVIKPGKTASHANIWF